MIPYGRKTFVIVTCRIYWFEGSVIPYGRKTKKYSYKLKDKFEGSVIPYGRKTNWRDEIEFDSLRVV